MNHILREALVSRIEMLRRQVADLKRQAEERAQNLLVVIESRDRWHAKYDACEQELRIEKEWRSGLLKQFEEAQQSLELARRENDELRGLLLSLRIAASALPSSPGSLERRAADCRALGRLEDAQVYEGAARLLLERCGSMLGGDGRTHCCTLKRRALTRAFR